MADTPPRKRSWKDAASAPKSRPVEEAWRGAQGPSPQGPPWWKLRWVRLSFVTAALLLVAALIVVVVYMWRPIKPMQMILIGPDYKTNLFVPPDVPGRNAVEELMRLRNNWGDAKEVALDHHSEAVEEALAIPFLEKAPKTLFVFVSAHGVARFEQGGLVPYLVRQDDDLHDPAALYPLDRVLDALARRPADTRTLLLLDVTQVSSHWPLGELYNDFATALANRADRIKEIKNLVVISSSDVDQRSWPSPEWGQTYFAHFVLEGLRGAADGAATGNTNGRVDAHELFRYLQSEVARWAWHTRARVQTPVMFGDEARARKMDLVNCEDYRPNNSLPEREDEKLQHDFESLKKAWEECLALRQVSPHPAASAPHLWRRCLDMMLRAEQLLRGGDAGAATKLLGEVRDLQARIEQSRSLELKSAQLTLAMPAALGASLTDSQQKKLEHIDSLWKENDPKKDDPFKDCDKEPPLLRAALAGQVTRNVAMAPEKLLNYGRRSLAKLDALAEDGRPAEVHYLMMLRPEAEASRTAVSAVRTGETAGLPMLLDKQRWPLLQKSLQVRLLAEQAALGLGEEKADEHLPAYSEQVLPWIKTSIEDADEQRRLGQDLLFTSDPKQWDEADRLLGKAHEGYQKAQKLAVTIRRALDVRDRVHAELPYYTHWVAERGSEHEQFAIALWNNWHELAHQLDEPAAGEAAIARQAAKLEDLRQSLHKDFKELERRILASAAEQKPNSQDRWHEIEAVLAVPFLPPDLRLNRIKVSRDISRELFENTPKEGDPAISGGEREGKPARQGALRQGRLALAVLSDWPESAAIKTELDNAIEETWRSSLTRAGEQVGRLLNRLPEDADKRCEKAAMSDNLKSAGEELRWAVRNARTIEGAAVLTRMTRNPIDESRRLHWHHLLVWQALRTYRDWWAGWKPGQQPYYQWAAKIFLDDAEKLITNESANPNAGSGTAVSAVRTGETPVPPRLKQVEEQREQLRKAPKVLVKAALSPAGDFQAGPARLDLTDEPEGVERYYRLYGPDAKEVPGYPVMWAEVQPQAQSGLRVIDEKEGRKKAQFGPAYRLKIARDRRTEPPGTASSRHIIHSFFRGHHSDLETEVRMYRQPDLTLSAPRKHGGGSVAVQTKQSLYALLGAKRAAISIVLDCSGSMLFPDPNKPDNPNNRFHKATRALKSVLEELPEGVTVSLRAFGAWKDDPTNLHPEKDRIELVWAAHQWQPDQLEGLMRRVDKLRPYWHTPLLRSIRVASRDFPRSSDDPFAARTVIVLTDGGDSEFHDGTKASDLKEESRADTIADYLKYLKKDFDKTGTQLIVIGFDVKEKELGTLNELRSYREFKTAMKDTGFVYEDAEDVEKLTRTLRISLLRSYFRIDADFAGSRVNVGSVSAPITPGDEFPAYVPLPPDRYRVRIPSIQGLEQPIDVGPGEVLLLDLERNPGAPRPAFRQSMYADSGHLLRLHGPNHIRKAQPVEGWLLAVLQNKQPREHNSLQLLAALQKDQGIAAPRDTLKQVRPEWYWFEIPAVRADSGRRHLHITPVSNYPATAWRLDLSRWEPRQAPVKLKAWWHRYLPSRPHGILVKGVDFQDPFLLLNHSWTVGVPPESVLLEGLSIEKHRLKVEEGQPEAEIDCLVVRLSYPSNKGPFFVRWPGWDGGQEHRFYTEAGTYTGLFWSNSKTIKEMVEKELKSLELYSVAKLKENALHPEDLDVGPPNEEWDPPSPCPVGKWELP